MRFHTKRIKVSRRIKKHSNKIITTLYERSHKEKPTENLLFLFLPLCYPVVYESV